MPVKRSSRKRKSTKRANSGAAVRRGVPRRRRDPVVTRKKLIEAALDEFSTQGFYGTDTNKIARAAGFTPGTFYVHFADKHEIFETCYLQVLADLREEGTKKIRAKLGDSREVASATFSLILQYHRRWGDFLTDVKTLATCDENIGRLYNEQQSLLIQLLGRLRSGVSGGKPNREEDALMYFMLERTCSAIASGESKGLKLRNRTMIGLLEEVYHGHLLGKSMLGKK